MENYKNAIKHYNQLLTLTTYITIDTAKKLKIFKITNYECLLLFIKIAPWIQAIVHEITGENMHGGVNFMDITHSTSEAVVISKKLNAFKKEKFNAICNILATELSYDQLDYLHNLMISFVARSNDEEAQQMQIKLEINRDTLKKAAMDKEYEENDRSYNAALETITIFMEDKIFKGPLGITKKLDLENIQGSIPYITDPITRIMRSRLENNDFMNYDIGNLLIIDVNNFYTFNYDDTLRMEYPYSIMYEHAAINEWTRHVEPEPQYVELEKDVKLEKDFENGSRAYTDNRLNPEDFEWRLTVDKVDGINKFVLRLKAGAMVFGYTDSIITEIVLSPHFVNHFKQRNITICMGFEENDKIHDYLNMKQEKNKLEKEKKEMQKIIDKLKEENNKLKTGNNANKN